MAWQPHRWAYLHAAADAGAAALTVSVATATGFGKENLIDYRAQSLLRLNAAQTAFNVILDRGAAGLEAVDRLVIPSGHNLGAATLTVHRSTTGAFGGEEVQLGTVAAPGAGAIDLALTSSTHRYLRLSVSGPSAVYEFGELFFTRVRIPTRGWDPGYDDRPVRNAETRRTARSYVTTLYGAAQSEIRAKASRYRGADLTLLDELISFLDLGLPLWYWRPDSAAKPIYVLGELEGRVQDSPAPAFAGEAFGPSFVFRETV
jgi:hypothetical protein